MATVSPDATRAGGYDIAPVSDIDPEWREAFISACSEWKEYEGFVTDGGVPGCRVPPFGPKLLARWWALGANEHDAHDPRPARGTYGHLAALSDQNFAPGARADYARNAVYAMIDEDNSYTPDM
jgi:hypothetical protein